VRQPASVLGMRACYTITNRVHVYKITVHISVHENGVQAKFSAKIKNRLKHAVNST